MLKKTIISFKEFMKNEKPGVLVKINTEEELNEIINKKTTGIQIKSSLVTKKINFKYISLIIDSDNIKEAIDFCKHQNFIELIIPIEKYNKNINYNVKKIILKFKDLKLIKNLDEIFADLITKGIYPLTEGIPLDIHDKRHKVEFFEEVFK